MRLYVVFHIELRSIVLFFCSWMIELVRYRLLLLLLLLLILLLDPCFFVFFVCLLTLGRFFCVIRVVVLVVPSRPFLLIYTGFLT